jgi:hypothetical protein
MQTLFQRGPDSYTLFPLPDLPAATSCTPPRLLLEMPSWPEVFFGNLADLLRAPFCRAAPAWLTSAEASYWPDVFVPPWRPWQAFRQSALYHVFAVIVLWGFCQTWWGQRLLKPRRPFENYTVIYYYPTSEYLPAIEDKQTLPSPRVEHKGEPAYARQHIVSIPPHPDNSVQTIVTPSPLDIPHHVRLPNIVAWSDLPVAPAPAAAAASMRGRLIAPQPFDPVAPSPQTQGTGRLAPAMILPAPVPPPPQLERAARELRNIRAADPVEPPPETDRVTTYKQAPAVPPAVEPIPQIENTHRAGPLKMARIEPTVAEPRLSEPEQQPIRIKSMQGPAGATRRRESATPPPSLSAISPGSNQGSSTLDHIVVLGLNPATPQGPIAVPLGNRRGEFAAGPEGKPGAPGTPDRTRDGFVSADRGATNGSAGNGNSPLSGITVAAAPINPEPAAMAGPSVELSPSAASAAKLTSAKRAPLPRLLLPHPGLRTGFSAPRSTTR